MCTKTIGIGIFRPLIFWVFKGAAKRNLTLISRTFLNRFQNWSISKCPPRENGNFLFQWSFRVPRTPPLFLTSEVRPVLISSQSSRNKLEWLKDDCLEIMRQKSMSSVWTKNSHNLQMLKYKLGSSFADHSYFAVLAPNC